MKLQKNEALGNYYFYLPKTLVETIGWVKGDEFRTRFDVKREVLEFKKVEK